ncbi:MAG TPA: hypothetical protein VFC84_13245 [Desulfosporosinus sp.]|nr:hypothetical protein [Desulfosporosinus sp.]
MLVKLLGYELYKKWKMARYILGGFIVLQVILLIITSVFLGTDATRMITEIGNNGQNGSFTFGVITILYFVFAVGVFFFPFIETINRFEKDLSGKQAVLELMIPIISWKKILAKLIVAVVTTVVFQMIAALSVLAYILVNSDFNKKILDSIIDIVKTLMATPAKSLFATLSFLFFLASLYMLIMFCIAFSKSISHKNRIAVPIGIGMFIACFALAIVAAIQIGRFPIVEFALFGIERSLSEMIFNLLAFVLPFLGASYLIEKRIEN